MSDQPKNDNMARGFATGGEAAAEQAAPQPGMQADYEAFMRLVKENEELKDRVLRSAADMENLRRRTQREVQDARAYAIANFARDMLGVSDNLRRALDAVPEDVRHALEGGIRALVDGVEITERDMLTALEKHGVKRIDPKGERFDPNFHQAMFEMPDETVPHNTVTQVVQVGYSIGDRVLRPAMVGVSRGGPKAPQPAGVAQGGPAAPAEPGPPNEQAEKDA